MRPDHPLVVGVLATVAEVYGIDVEILRGKGRTNTVAEARHFAWWVLRHKTGWSYPELGRALGTDHTVVLHGVRRTSARVLENKGSSFMQAALKLCEVCVQPEAQPPDKPRPTVAQPVDTQGQGRGVPPSPLASPLPSHSLSGSVSESSSALSSPAEGPVSKPAREAKPKVTRWRFVPDDWAPNDAHRKLALEQRVNLDEEVKKFRDHEFKEPKTDADRAFNRWLRTAGNGFGSNGGKPPEPPPPRRPELRPILPPRPVQEATPLEVLAHVGQVLRPAPAPAVAPGRRMTAAELDKAVEAMTRERKAAE